MRTQQHDINTPFKCIVIVGMHELDARHHSITKRFHSLLECIDSGLIISKPQSPRFLNESFDVQKEILKMPIKGFEQLLLLNSKFNYRIAFVAWPMHPNIHWAHKWLAIAYLFNMTIGNSLLRCSPRFFNSIYSFIQKYLSIGWCCDTNGKMLSQHTEHTIILFDLCACIHVLFLNENDLSSDSGRTRVCAREFWLIRSGFKNAI